MQAEYLLEEEKRISEHWKHQTLGKEEEEGNNSDEESVDKMIVNQPKPSCKGKERVDPLIPFHSLSPSKMTTLEQRITNTLTAENTESPTPKQPTSSKSLRFIEGPTLTDKSLTHGEKQRRCFSKSDYNDEAIATGTPTPTTKSLPPKQLPGYNVSEESEPKDKGNKLIGKARRQQNVINCATQKALQDKAVSRGIITKTEVKWKMKKEFDPI
ncbi:hypothetical protein GYMLUDRAFT_252038 [Collybiopsis luxurians FD-317 M1]|uniref:Uncharacterized protein n=1 Tax=Collybiopsis luxurians FD-317 M1 TaxID=944289 RepID=A0A0D0AMT2_9AGAR|nr:hypothetical protein GYMLUDRAFT_252038 [Collybiopsis luxurians FD-317 M1]